MNTQQISDIESLARRIICVARHPFTGGPEDDEPAVLSRRQALQDAGVAWWQADESARAEWAAARIRDLVGRLCDRIAAQSELLSRKAEASP